VPAKLPRVRSLLTILLLAASALDSARSQPAQPSAPPLASSQAQALVERALAAELHTAQDTSHPMRYRLRKSSPRLTSTKEIVETRDGAVAQLVSVYDRPLTPAEQKTEQARLDLLLSDPGRQQHRKLGEEGDIGIVLKLLRMLPRAYLYQYSGAVVGPSGAVQRFTFRPNPAFSPPDFETQALTAMDGEIWIDAAQERVTRLEGHLQQDTDYGWGILGKLDKGGWIVIEQADVGGRQWRIARFKMQMNLRVLFKTRSIDTTEEMTQYTPVPVGIDYRQAIRMLRAGPGAASPGSR